MCSVTVLGGKLLLSELESRGWKNNDSTDREIISACTDSEFLGMQSYPPAVTGYIYSFTASKNASYNNICGVKTIKFLGCFPLPITEAFTSTCL